MDTLEGKTAAVTGAAAGIGLAIAERLLARGAKVALLDVDVTSGQKVKKVLDQKFGSEKSLFLKCDVQSEEEVKASLHEASRRFKGLDMLVNNAGVLLEGDWQKTVSINLVGVIRASYLGLELMSLASGGRGGVIINMASMAGVAPLPSCPVYTATKSGVVGFTRAMAVVSGASGLGVRFNVLCPGFVETQMINDLQEKLAPFEGLRELNQQLIDKIGIISAAEVADCFLELVTDETKNGEVLMVCQKLKRSVTFPSIL